MMWQAIAVGLGFGAGVALIAAWVRARRPSLALRIAPYVRASTADEIRRRSVTVSPLPTLERILAPMVRDGVRLLERYGSPSDQLRRRLRRSGATTTVEQFRAQQVIWGIAGLLAGLALALLLAAARGASVVSLTILVVVAAAGAMLARDAWLTRAIKKRERRLLAELPTVAEMLALAVGAGESAVAALDRVARLTHGAMSEELAKALGEVRAGARLPAALTGMAEATELPAMTRFAEGIATAVERGTPLGQVLRAQAADVRSRGHEALMEEGGKREIAMLVPVVFIILPITVLFAVFPGLMTLRWGL
ncbi:type II secretion system F family protein [Demequina sp. NBRC 110055]|uniref:type II secretion system F family protein n=1 Tax=Demequina sp. NBRC 110055 TaxID=1570344 RepID=UPI001186B8EB|nr:type II secretion system F family protein [Demequina sp. NBRC 110055]